MCLALTKATADTGEWLTNSLNPVKAVPHFLFFIAGTVETSIIHSLGNELLYQFTSINRFILYDLEIPITSLYSYPLLGPNNCAMAAAIKAINAKIRSNKVSDYFCSTRMF